MRPRPIVVLAILGLLSAALPSAALPVTPVVPPLPAVATDNVTHHGTVPLDHPGVGGEVVHREDLGKTFFYVTGAYGLSIYDVEDPTSPVRVGYLSFPHSQNEDLKVSDDGTRAVIAADGSLPFSPNMVTTGVHIVDTTDVENPTLVGSTSELVRQEGAGRGTSEHTVACADAACEFIYGSSTGNIYDATDPADITVVGQWNVDPDGATIPSRHALNRDESGLLVSDSSPRVILDPVGVIVDGARPDAPVAIAAGNRAAEDPRLQHNNVRTDAGEWIARDAEEPVATTTVEPGPRSRAVVDERPVLRPGELLIGQSESNVNPNCNNGGGLSTWSMVNFDHGAELQQLEVFQPYSGTWADGSPPANAAGCSGHWFTERDGIVAGAWYEHGTRFFDVDKTTGTITEIGYFQPVAGIASATYWIDDEFAYTVDNLRGIDILQLHRDSEAPSQEELTARWLADLGLTDPVAEQLRLACRLATAD